MQVSGGLAVMREVDNTYMAVLFLMLVLGVCALFVIN
jgi:uncharacterized membrane protein YqhA